MDRFIVEQKLTSTLQGAIYLATDTRTHQAVAIKTAHKHLVQSKRSLHYGSVIIAEDFLRERYLTQSLVHRGLVSFVASWDDGENYCLAMEYCEGGDLFSFVKQRHDSWTRFGARPWIRQMKGVFRQIASTLSWLHCRGFFHRDLSLENFILVSDDDELTVKIIDYGLMESRDDSVGGDLRCTQRVGKLNYMSPETFECDTDGLGADGNWYDLAANDVWCFGICIYVALTACLPYDRAKSKDRKPPALRCIWDGNIDYLLQFYNLMPFMDGFAVDLLQHIFVPQRARLTIDRVLSHPFLNVDGIGGNMLINGYISTLCQSMEGYHGMDTIDNVHPFIVDWIYGYYGQPGRDAWDSSEEEEEEESEHELLNTMLSAAASGSKNSVKPNYPRKRLSLTLSSSMMDPLEHDYCRISDDECAYDDMVSMDNDEFWIPQCDYLTVEMDRGSRGHHRNHAISSDILRLLDDAESGSILSQGSEYEIVQICR